MKFVRAGLFVDQGSLTLVALTGRDRVEAVTADAGDSPAALLRAECEARRLRLRGMRMGLDRNLVTVKTLEVPPGAGDELTQMVAFELERHVPFSPEDMRSDFHVVPRKSNGKLRVLVAAAERRTVERPLRALEEARYRPRALTIACHELRGLLPRRIEPRRVVWAHRHGGRTDLVFLGRGHVRLSRNIVAERAEALGVEIQRSLRLVHWTGLDALWVSGDDAEAIVTSAALAGLGAVVSEPPYPPAVSRLIAALPAEDQGRTLLALAVAMGTRRPLLDLLPAHLRPWSLSRAQWKTAGMAAVTMVLGLSLLFVHAYRQERSVVRLSQEIVRLDPEVTTVARLAAEVAQQKGLLTMLEAAERGGLPALPVMQELTELLPQDAWMQALSVERQGVEITGQAKSASPLIPILEGSPWLERVEFTAPVTKGQDMEQFRLKAAWEAGATRRPAAPASGGR